MTTAEQTAKELRKIIGRLDKLEGDLYEHCSDQEAKDARKRVYAASNELLVAVHYLEGNK